MNAKNIVAGHPAQRNNYRESNISFLTWYKVMLLSTATKRLFSKKIQQQLGLKHYEPVWTMVDKLHKVTGKRDNRYTLERMIKMDKCYFTIEALNHGHKTQKLGLGSKTKSDVTAMLKSTILQDLDAGRIECQCRYFKAKVLDNYKVDDSTDQTLQNAINQDQSIIFKDHVFYINITDYAELHIRKKSSAKTTKVTLKWVHIAISNAKLNFVGNYHKIKRKYLQLYLNKFVYKFNHRYFGEEIFNNLVIANITGI